MNRNALVLVALFSLLAATACAPDGRSANVERDFCSGDFDCSGGRGRVTKARTGESCRIGRYWLDPDGSVRAIDWPLPDYDWLVNDDSVAICNRNPDAGETACTVCVPAPTGPAPAPTSAGRCEGSRSCSSVSPGSCSTIDGCYLSLGSTFSEDDDSCDGSPDSCDSYTEARCDSQYGCNWRN